MEVKIVILLLLIICLFLNFLQEKESFQDLKGGHLHIRNVVEAEVDAMLAEGALKHGSTDDTTTHDKLINLTTEIKQKENGVDKTYDKTHKLSLAEDKVLLTLFYDPLDKNSADFYDDSMVSESEIVSGSFSSPTPTDNNDMDEVIKISSMEMKPWNKLKKVLNTLQNVPYASNKFLYLEEIKCSAKRMEECHLQDSILVRREENSPTNTLGKQILSETPPRGKDLVEKLPKVIFSFLKPNGFNEKGEEVRQLYQIEYEGLYTMFEDNNPISMYNMIKYMKESVDKNLETKEIDLDTPGQSKDVLRMIYHYKQNHHVDQNITLKNADGTGDVDNIVSQSNNPKFILLNQERLLMPPFFNNTFIYKCSHCPMFVKTSNKIS